MKKLTLNEHTAMLEGIHLRMTNLGKTQQLVADLKLSLKTDAKNVTFLSRSLFDRKGGPRIGCDDEIHFATKLKNHDLIVKETPKKEQKYYGVELKKFSAVLLQNKRIELRFNTSIKLSGQKVGELSEHIMSPLTISIIPQKQLFDKKKNGKKTTAPKAKNGAGNKKGK